MQNELKLVRYSQENMNVEGLKGKYGYDGQAWGSITVIKNVAFVIAYKGANVTDYMLPEVYDGFLICSDGSRVQVTDSKLTLALGAEVSAQGMLKLKKDN